MNGKSGERIGSEALQATADPGMGMDERESGGQHEGKGKYKGKGKHEDRGKHEGEGKYEKGQDRKKKYLALGTKYLLDFMFYIGILVTATLPFSIRKIGELLPYMIEHYEETVIIYFVLGIAALVLVRELRKIFKTVLAEDCFVQENVISLQKMGNWSFFIAVMSVVRSIVYMTVAMGVVILVFVIAGLFSKVLACVFEEAVRYKQENDLTI